MLRGRRPLAGSVAALLLVWAVTGCTSAPAPSPTPTGFASEEEAFAAAEATYRAYVDALNQRREDPNSTADPRTFLTGHALESDITTQRDLQERGLKIIGPTTITSQRLADTTGVTVTIDVCLDSSQTRAISESGEDVTPKDRAATVSVRVHLSEDSGELLINSSEANEEPC